MPGSGIAGPYGKTLVLINANLASKAAGCTILRPYQQRGPAPVATPPCRPLVFAVF